jgi:16S rRNA (cytosine1402-N4)-methyltransferase
VIAYSHQTVLLHSAIHWLQPAEGQWIVDGTLGGGGHSEAILKATKTGQLLGFDRDGDAIDAAAERLRPFSGRFRLIRADFAEMEHHVPLGEVAGVLLDLGISSHQLDTASRGFGFEGNTLDMRLDTRATVTAEHLVNGLELDELIDLMRRHGDEPEARRIARAIVRRRTTIPFTSARELAAFVEQVCPRRGRKSHPATRLFQALRYGVNREPESLKLGLRAAMNALRPGGRLCVISFESGTDRMTRDFMRAEARDYDAPGEIDDPMLRIPRPPRARILTRKPILPDPEEVAANSRARSAQLRVLEKI